MQYAPDLLQDWIWIPAVESGNGETKAWDFEYQGEKGFWRLVSSDIPSNDPANDDFDGDGVSNLAELLSGTHPLVVDEDGDGIWDVFEVALIQAGLGDINGDGLVTLEDVRTEDDYDQDGFNNGEELAASPGTRQPISDVKSSLSVPRQSPPVRFIVLPIEMLSEDRFMDRVFGFTDSGYLLYSVFPNWDDPAIFYRWHRHIRDELNSATSLNPWTLSVYNITESGAAVGYFEAGVGLSPAFTNHIPITQTVAAVWPVAWPNQPIELPYGSYTWNASLVYGYIQNGQSLTGTVTGPVYYARGLALDGDVVYGRMCIEYQELPAADAPVESYRQTFGSVTWTNGAAPALYNAGLTVDMVRGGVTAGYRNDAKGPDPGDDIYVPQINGRDVEMLFYDMDIHGRMLGERKVGYNRTGDIQLYDGASHQYLTLPVPDTAVPYALGGKDQYLGSAAGMDAVALWLRDETRKKHVPYNLNDLVGEGSGWTITRGHKVNSSSTVIAEARKDGVDYLVALVHAEIIPNFDRNETIDLTGAKDRGKVTQEKPWRWWINDDNDHGDIASGDSDVPGSEPVIHQGYVFFTADHANPQIDGRCDLVDFFPLFFDIKNLLDVLPPGPSLQYKLKHEQDALNFVYTDLTPNRADDFCVEDIQGEYGPSFIQPAGDALVTPITAAGVVLSETFLNKIKNEGKGILLFEASKATDKPLILEVAKYGQKVAELKFFIKTDSVEKMYRWVNLRASIGAAEVRPTDLGEPPNYPDNLTGQKNLILVHGYSVNENGSRGWNAEVFKRLHQLGSRAKFIGVTWRGDDSSQFTFGWRTPDYHENVIHAFDTSPHLATAMNGLPGEKYIIGHSLGNMVVSSAMKDHSMSVSKYFAVDAAVAMEAYDTTVEEQLMRHPDWRNYNTRLYGSEWYKLFGLTDSRNKLTWRGRFTAFGNAINFYSQGEEVLRNLLPKQDLPEVPATDGAMAWVTQERAKGTLLAAITTFGCHGGWGFNSGWNVVDHWETNADGSQFGIMRRRTPAEADQLSDDQLRNNSFFLRFNDSRLYDSGQGSVAASDYLNRARILAEAVPALSFATGANSLQAFGAARNVDMMDLKTGIWPRQNENWHHSDYREVAFYFTRRLYKRFIDEGGLKL